MPLHFSKYQGAGNDFVMIDNRTGWLPPENRELYARWCHRHFGVGADGLILLNTARQIDMDFEMAYYNADGNIGSMCGNGGRCIVAFAHWLGIIGHQTRFWAADGAHEASINNDGTISLKMQDVKQIIEHNKSCYIVNTGSPHYVRLVSDIAAIDIAIEGKAIRQSPPFVQEGINVNFVQIMSRDTLLIATFERGVEAETLACGTGVVAASIAAHCQWNHVSPLQQPTLSTSAGMVVYTHVIAKGGNLQTQFTLNDDLSYSNIWLTGGAEKVFDGVL